MNRFMTLVRMPGVAALWLAIAPLPAVAQPVSPWPVGTSPPFLQGPTLAATLRNGAQVASDQARVTAQFAREMGGRARSAGYQMQNLRNDY